MLTRVLTRVLGGAGVTLPHGMVKVGMDTDSGDNVGRHPRRTLTFGIHIYVGTD